MADTGEDREIKARLEANEAERFRESQQLATKTKEGNGERARPVGTICRTGRRARRRRGR